MKRRATWEGHILISS